MIAVAVIVTLLLAAGAALALARVVRGPSILDRIVATDVLLAIVMVGVAAEAAFSRDATALPILAVLSILGFTGAVSVARFATRKSHPAAASPSAAATSPAACEPAGVSTSSPAASVAPRAGVPGASGGASSREGEAR